MLVIKVLWSHLGWKAKSLAANVINSQTLRNPTRLKARHYLIQISRRNLYLSNTQNTSCVFSESISITTSSSLNFGKIKSEVDRNFAGRGRRSR